MTDATTITPGILQGMRIIEGSCYVAAPSAGTTLALMGADVIKFDPIGGAIDYQRYPVTEDGQSLYWPSMNKHKRSIAIDVRSAEGRELVRQLVANSGEDGGIFLSNFALRGELSYQELRSARADLIYAQICGDRFGGSQVDYTVNNQVGYPNLTGTREHPVNNVVPAWDLVTGQLTALSILAAERHRRLTGEGQKLLIPLKDVALFGASSLGLNTEYEVTGAERQSIGNHLYGGFGRDFTTADGRRIMVVGLSNKQWQTIKKVTGIGEAVDRIAAERALPIDDSEAARFAARESLCELVEAWVGARSLDALTTELDAAGVCWSVYRSVSEALAEDPDFSEANPLFQRVEQPGIGSFLASGVPTIFDRFERTDTRRAPVLGEHTDEILSQLLGLDSGAIAALHDRGVVAGA